MSEATDRLVEAAQALDLTIEVAEDRKSVV